MKEQFNGFSKKLISCYFDSSTPDAEYYQVFKVLHEIKREKGNSGIAEYTPTVHFLYQTQGFPRPTSMYEIRMKYSFIIRKTTPIIETDLFGAIKFVCDRIEGFMSHNRDDFKVQVKLNPENAKLLPELSEVLDLPY